MAVSLIISLLYRFIYNAESSDLAYKGSDTTVGTTIMKIVAFGVVSGICKEIQYEIKQETQDVFKAPFGVDIVIDGIGRMTIELSKRTVLCYKTDDLQIQLTAVGNIDS